MRASTAWPATAPRNETRNETDPHVDDGEHLRRRGARRLLQRAALDTGADGEVTAVHFLVVTVSRSYAPVALGIWCADWELGCEALGIEGDFVRVFVVE